MVITGIQAYNAMINYMKRYKKEIGNEDEINKTIKILEDNKDSFISKNYSKLEAYKEMFNTLDKIFDEKQYGELGVLLSEMELLSDGDSADSAALEDWISIVKQVVNEEYSSSNSVAILLQYQQQQK